MDQRCRLRQILEQSSVSEVLPRIAQAGLPHWWLAGGAVRNTVWRALFPQACQLTIKDYDVAFFDAGGDRQQELDALEIMAGGSATIRFDVKNQASFGRWRWPGTATYSSTEDGIANWLHTATAVGVRLNPAGEWEFFTPYGLSDLFAGIVRATPGRRDDPAAQQKATELIARCPCLRQAF